MQETISFQIMVLYRDFLSYTTRALKEYGVNFGQMPLILYMGKHAGCRQAELKQDLHLDWGYSQRSISKLVEDGLVRKDYDPALSCNRLTLTERGQMVFDTCHDVFQSWDQLQTGRLTRQEADRLLELLCKLSPEGKESR